MKKIITLTLIFFSLITLNAQIGLTKAEIIEEFGTTFEEDKTTDDKTPYIVYEKEFDTKASGKYTRKSAFYFTENKSKELICFLRKVIEPSSEINSFVKYYNGKGYVKINELKWKNYENNIAYELEIDDGSCILSVYRD
ncbi:hypothetical protein [Polaribacter sp. NJDZ03]|uniref:hypothetical protein n=1 Tax=Polaribacter sp. NJDZ03 TaxID=2855841 RepID=UPI001C49F0C9|nr:hypothetical protein [Polaribacter sp. NJDZ03]